MNKQYILVEWPESQEWYELFYSGNTNLIPYDDISIFVPLELYGNKS